VGQGVQWVAGTWGVAEDGTHGLPNVRFIDPVVPLKLRGTVGGIRALGPQRVGLFSKRVRRHRGTRTGPVLFPMGHRAAEEEIPRMYRCASHSSGGGVSSTSK